MRNSMKVMYINSGYKTPKRQVAVGSQFFRSHQILVGPQYGTRYMSPFPHKEFELDYKFLEDFCTHISTFNSN
jgi:hypothetical protein